VAATRPNVPMIKIWNGISYVDTKWRGKNARHSE
jgi:hypothetical protein